ncbi:MAG: amylo-alpha-1,6-glucosidase [Firmicutes bacterium]|nr:amylo-alpha-1,6-glucosidase [Bacillota bacterium]
MKYLFQLDEILSKNHHDPLEWVLTNGMGGYASSSAIGSHFRKHHGYLIASLSSPIKRKVIFSKTEEVVVLNNQVYQLSSQEYELNSLPENSFLTHFELSEVATYHYLVNQIMVKKTISPFYGHNTCAILYNITTQNKGITFQINPLFNYRSHSEVSSKNSLNFETSVINNTLQLIPFTDQNQVISFSIDKGTFIENEEKYTRPFFYDKDNSTGDSRKDTHFQPYHIDIEILPFQTINIEVVCSLGTPPKLTASEIRDAYIERAQELIKLSKVKTDLGRRLVLASDQFIAYRKSTNLKTVLAGLPWFSDWGRDTMIAFEGLFLSTKRFLEAKEVLKSFSLYEKDGLIPNLFPDEGESPLYNTCDASLWYIHAIYQYALYTKDYYFIHNELFQTMKNIVNHYIEGTQFNIGMDQFGFIHAGSGLDQVTWMDVRINEEVITPRHGIPVEINALWYNSLVIMSKLSELFDEDNKDYMLLAKIVKKNFNHHFWNAKTNCLYDVLNPKDDSIRPNQLFAISLTFPVLSMNKAKKVLTIVTSKLLDVYGIRTLSKDDPRFKSSYTGNLETRDHAYHMGTSWGYLLGSYMESLLIVHRFSKKAQASVLALYQNINQQLHNGCINGYSEIFDGLNGDVSRGCYTQAWSIGEILRVYEKYKIGLIGENKNEIR